MNYIGKIFKGSRSQTVMSILNEIFSLTQTYILLLFTNVLSDPDQIFDVGWVVVGLIVLQIAINLVNMGYQSAKEVAMKYKRKIMMEKVK